MKNKFKDMKNQKNFTRKQINLYKKLTNQIKLLIKK